MAFQKGFKSKYKYVVFLRSTVKSEGLGYYTINIRGVTKKLYKTEREAAVAVDKYLIGKGKEPVNILVRREKN
jgi:hypothetical protein